MASLLQSPVLNHPQAATRVAKPTVATRGSATIARQAVSGGRVSLNDVVLGTLLTPVIFAIEFLAELMFTAGIALTPSLVLATVLVLLIIAGAIMHVPWFLLSLL